MCNFHVFVFFSTDALNEINCTLACEDQTLRTFRRAIGCCQNVKNDLIPLLINVKELKIVDMAIRILVNLTAPVECLFSVEVMLRTDAGRNTIYELNKLLATSKEAFTDVRATRAVVDHMKSILEKDSKLSFAQCDSVNNCLLLLRNILHIPENAKPNVTINNHATSMQNQIVWNLFTLSIDKLLIHLMSCPQKAFWSVTMVQFIALMYKDQHVSTLQKLLNLWFEDSLSDSSEDFESNTSPPKQVSGDSSPMLTSDPTSDSSDNGGNIITKFSNVTENYVETEGRRTPSTSKEVDASQASNTRKLHEFTNPVARPKPNNTKQQMTLQQKVTSQKLMTNVSARHSEIIQVIYLNYINCYSFFVFYSTCYHLAATAPANHLATQPQMAACRGRGRRLNVVHCQNYQIAVMAHRLRTRSPFQHRVMTIATPAKRFIKSRRAIKSNAIMRSIIHGAPSIFRTRRNGVGKSL